MAVMNPAHLPNYILNDPKMRGEIDTFEALKKLPDDFEVFYNRTVHRGAVGAAFDSPIDFIIIHPIKGLLALEVKGGKIRLNEDGGFEQHIYYGWKSTTPHQQVKRALRKIIMAIKSDGANYWIPDDVCVFFPHTPRHIVTDAPHLIPIGTLFAEELFSLHIVIPSLFTNKRRAWKEEAFIDMRRRLQNMPEQEQRGFVRSFMKRKREFSSSSDPTSTVSNVYESFSDKGALKSLEPIIQVHPFARPEDYPIHLQVKSYQRLSLSRPREWYQLKKWEIVAVVVLCLAIAAGAKRACDFLLFQ